MGGKDSLDSIRVFEELALEYDKWFEENRFVYETELRAVREHIPKGFGVEIGVGTGRFAAPLGVDIGVEPARSMVRIARKRGLEVIIARAEKLPFKKAVFDYALLIVTICFIGEPIEALEEAKRVIKPGGSIIIGLIDKNSFLGKLYESRKEKSRFYRYANFYSTKQVIEWLEELEFNSFKVSQTVFEEPKNIKNIQPVIRGYGEGGFVVVSGAKQGKS